jgi:hypothetical protein
MSKRPTIHRYRVGMLTDVRTIEAPSPVAAAVFYGVHSAGRFGTMCEVFEQDDAPWRGEAIWRRWAMDDEPSTQQLELLKAQLPFCRFVPALSLAA